MKEIDIIMPHERLSEVNEILHKHKVGGMYFSEITGWGSAKREEAEHLVGPDRYKTGKRYVPEFGSRTKVTVIIPDSIGKQLTDDIIGEFYCGSCLAFRD